MEKSKVMMIVIIVLLVALLGTTGGLGFVLMKNLNAPQKENQPVVEIATSIDLNEIALISIAEPVITNIASTGTANANSMAKVSFDIGVNSSKKVKKDSEALATLLTEKETVIRDIVISIVSNKTYDELKRLDSKEIFREELLKKLQDEFQSNLIVAIYINVWQVV